MVRNSPSSVFAVPVMPESFFVQAEEILEGDGRVRLVLVADFHPFLRLDGLVQAVRIAAADHQTAGELVDDDDFAVVDDVILVAVEQLVRLQSLLNVVVEGGVVDVAQVVDVEEALRFRRAALGNLHGARLAVDDVIPVAVFIALGDVVVVAVLGFFLRLLLFLRLSFALFLCVVVLFRLDALVLESAVECADKAVDPLVQLARLIPLARNDERGARLVDENGVDLVDDGEGEFALHHLFDVRL